MFDHKTKLLEQLHKLPSDLSVLSQCQIAPAIATLRRVETLTAGGIAALTHRARELESQGVGDPVQDVLRVGGSISTAKARTQEARATIADTFPLVGAALVAGDASTENVDTLNRKLRGLTSKEQTALAKADSDLAIQANQLSPEGFRRRLNLQIRELRSKAGLSLPEQNKAASYARGGLNVSEGMHYFHAEFDPERGAEIDQALSWKTRSIARRDGTADQPLEINDNLRAQALYELIVDGVKYHDSCRSSGGIAGVSRIPSVSLLMDLRTFVSGPHAKTISETWAGAPLPPETAARLCCDANVSEVIIGSDGEALRVGRKHRSATDAQRRMLRSLYGGCAISGAPFTQCEIHHVHYWEKGGATDLDNLVPISKHWHHLVHEGGWRLEIGPDRALTLWRPDKSLYQVIPPPGSLPPTWGLEAWENEDSTELEDSTGFVGVNCTSKNTIQNTTEEGQISLLAGVDIDPPT